LDFTENDINWLKTENKNLKEEIKKQKEEIKKQKEAIDFLNNEKVYLITIKIFYK